MLRILPAESKFVESEQTPEECSGDHSFLGGVQGSNPARDTYVADDELAWEWSSEVDEEVRTSAPSSGFFGLRFFSSQPLIHLARAAYAGRFWKAYRSVAGDVLEDRLLKGSTKNLMRR